MNTVASFAAQLMEASGIHGFVYASQLWPELAPILPFTNSLVLVGLNPYKVAHSQYYKKNYPEIKTDDVPSIYSETLTLIDFIPGLNINSKDIHEEQNYLTWQNAMWNSHLIKIGFRVVKTSTLNLNHGTVRRETGSMDWKEFETRFIESVSCFKYNMFPTGIIRDIFWETTKIDYDYYRKFKNHPNYGDMFNWAIESYTNHMLFSIFLDRMFGEDEG